MKLYKLRWSNETNYYEQKTFWPIDQHMVRKHIGIERLVNMINIAHSMTKTPLYIDNMFYKHRNNTCIHTSSNYELSYRFHFIISITKTHRTAEKTYPIPPLSGVLHLPIFVVMGVITLPTIAKKNVVIKIIEIM